MTDGNEITLWMQQLEDHSPEAAERIWAHYYQKLVEFASRRLGAAPRRVADEEDIALSAMHSLHRGIHAGRFPQFQNRDDLWKILLTIAGAKVKKQFRSETAQKRGGGAVRGESVFANVLDGEVEGLANFEGSEPTPEFAELVSLECEERLAQLGDKVLEEIALLKLQGFTNEEIANEQHCAVRSVERKLKRIRAAWSNE